MADTGTPDTNQQPDTGDKNQTPDPEENNNDKQNQDLMDEIYLPDLNNTPLSQALKNGLDYGTQDEVMIECPKLKQYFGVDTFLVQRTSGRIRICTRDKIESFPIQCSRTKFTPSLLEKALQGAERQRVTPKDLPGEDWPRKIKNIITRMELDMRLDAYAELASMHARNSVSLEHAHMVNRGTDSDYYEIAKLKLRARKIANRMDEILAIMMQDNAYRQQCKFQTYATPKISPISQMISSPAEADKIGAAALQEEEEIMAIAYPGGPQLPEATTTTQTSQPMPFMVTTATTAATATNRLDHRKTNRPASPSFTMNVATENCMGTTANPLLIVNAGNDGNTNSFMTLTLVTNHHTHQDN